jgi:hypothetical protein
MPYDERQLGQTLGSGTQWSAHPTREAFCSCLIGIFGMVVYGENAMATLGNRVNLAAARSGKVLLLERIAQKGLLPSQSGLAVLPYRFLNMMSRSRSYVALRLPAMTNGQPNAELVRSAPANIGPSADAKLRGTAVTLAAAARSSGETTDITKEVRVGTSICESALRISSRVKVHCRSGAKGARARHRLAGDG